MRRALWVAVALAALALPAGAFAHASLTAASPGYRERVEKSPAAIVLSFNQGVRPLPDGLVVHDAAGRSLAGRARLARNGRTVLAALPARLPRGAYTVRWQALSISDGHVISGLYTFGVGVAAPPPTEAVGAGGPRSIEKVVRWLAYLGLALLAGGIGFRLVALPAHVPERVERRFYVLAGLGTLLAVNAGIAGFLLRAGSALELPFGRFLYADLSPFASGTRFGVAWVWMTLGTVLAGLLVAHAWLTGRRTALWPALALALLLGSGFSLSGHSASEPNSNAVSVLADWVHLAAASLWLGGLAMLALVTWPLGPTLRRDAFLRFSRLATGLVALVVVAGIYLGFQRLPAAADLWQTPYGRVLLLKVGLVAMALGWGAAHHVFVRPRLERSHGVPGGWIGRSLLGEGMAVSAVLLIAAFLANTAPPALPGTEREAARPAATGR